MIKKFVIFSLVVSAILIFSCKKASVDNETQTVTDFTTSQRICAEFFPYVENILYSDTNLAAGAFSTDSIDSNIIQNCVSITDISNTSTYPFSFTLDFGSGCMDSTLNVYLKGKLTIIINNDWDSTNAQMTINTDDFYIDNYSVNFNMSVVDNGDHNYTVNVNNGKMAIDNSNFNYKADLRYTQTHGNSTLGDISDDIWSINGNGSGVDREKRAYTFKILQPVIKKMNCKYPDKGTIDLTPENLVVRTIDYGNGACDEVANVVINGNNFEFNLK